MRAFAAVLCLLASASLGHANIVDVAVSQPDLSILVAAVQAAGLVDALANPTVPLTVFAPTNAAFEATLEALGLSAEMLLNDTTLLTNVLMYHVVPGVAAKAADLTDGEVLSTLLTGQNVTVSLPSPVTVEILSPGAIAPAKVILADVPGGDSVGSIIHVIDNVLVPDM